MYTSNIFVYGEDTYLTISYEDIKGILYAITYIVEFKDNKINLRLWHDYGHDYEVKI
jgi:hypothetical protein